MNLCLACGRVLADEVQRCPEDGEELVPHDPELSAGEVLAGRFRVVKAIGVGPCGEVYEGAEGATADRVVLRLLAEDLTRERRPAEALFRHLLKSRDFRHAHAARVRAVEKRDSRIVVVRDWVEGVRLHDCLAKENGLAVPRALALTLRICTMLQEAHREGLLHQQIRPSNVFLVPGPAEVDSVRVTDFGIGPPRKVAGRTIFGTVATLAPEQVENKIVSFKSDIYSAGVLLHTLIAGRSPFGGPEEAVAEQVVGAPLPPLRTPGGEPVPPAVESLVRQMAEKRPLHRPGGMTLVCDRLKQLLAEVGSPRPTPAAPEKPRPSTPAAPLRDAISEAPPPASAASAAAPAASAASASVPLAVAVSAPASAAATAPAPASAGSATSAAASAASAASAPAPAASAEAAPAPPQPSVAGTAGAVAAPGPGAWPDVEEVLVSVDVIGDRQIPARPVRRPPPVPPHAAAPRAFPRRPSSLPVSPPLRPSPEAAAPAPPPLPPSCEAAAPAPPPLPPPPALAAPVPSWAPLPTEASAAKPLPRVRGRLAWGVGVGLAVVVIAVAIALAVRRGEPSRSRPAGDAAAAPATVASVEPDAAAGAGRAGGDAGAASGPEAGGAFPQEAVDEGDAPASGDGGSSDAPAVAEAEASEGDEEEEAEALDGAVGEAVEAAGPESADDLVAQGYRALDRRNFGRARALFREALAIVPAHVRARAGLGKVAFQQGHFAEAVRWLEPLFANMGHMDLGSAYVRVGRLGDAKRQFELVLRRNPESAAARRALDAVNRQLGP